MILLFLLDITTAIKLLFSYTKIQKNIDKNKGVTVLLLECKKKAFIWPVKQKIVYLKDFDFNRYKKMVNFSIP